MKKSSVTQELVNVFPSWSKVRKDEQSIGQQGLNAFGNSMENMEKQLTVIRDNQFLTSANLDEIDLTFRVQLGTEFEFDEDNTDPLFPCPQPPTISGLVSGVWHDVSIATDNDILSFWYNSIPNRVSIGTTLSGVDEDLLLLDADETPVTGVYDHHSGGGSIWVETTGGVQYLTFEDNTVHRGKVLLKGKTRKGTLEEETLIFPWDMKQRTLKEWREIHEVHAFDMENDVQIEVRSADFSGGPYISPWNLKYSDRRNKIDEFWDLGHNGTIPTLDRIEYQSDEWQQLVLGFSGKDVKDSWELLVDTADVVSGVSVTVSGVDVAIQPYTDRAWVVTEDTLYCYDLSEETVSGVDDILSTTAGAHIQLDYDTDKVLLGDSIEFVPWHARPLKEIQSYRIWYRRPDGQKFGLLDGASVSFSSDFTKKVPQGTMLTRTVENFIQITTTQRGEYLVVFEATFSDGEQQEYRRIFRVQYKTPLMTIDLSPVISEAIEGIDFDSDQRMWVKTADKHYRLNLHTDIMLIDYENKLLYFKEEYEEVGIKTDG